MLLSHTHPKASTDLDVCISDCEEQNTILLITEYCAVYTIIYF